MGLRLILNEDVEHLGTVGDIVDVAPGYARNFLIPRNLAVPATTRNVKQLEHTKRLIGVKRAKALTTATELSKRLGEVSVTIARPVGEEDKLFGSVTNRDIADAVAKEGFTLDRRAIVLAKPIKSLGVYSVAVKLHADVSTQVKVWVVAE